MRAVEAQGASGRGRSGWLGAAGGAVAAAFVAAPLFPDLHGLTLLRERLALLAVGNLAAGLLAGGLLAWLLPLRRGGENGAYLAAGFALGLAPPLAARLLPGGGLLVRFLAAAVLLGAGVLAGRRLALPAGTGRTSGWLAGAATVLLGLLCALDPLGARPGPSLAPPRPSPGRGPDVLLVSVDTLRADALFRPGVPTPNLDRLRAASRWSDYGLAPSGETRPSHATMLSGLPVPLHGVWTNRIPAPGELPLLAERFRQEGWRTAAVVSNGVLSAASGLDRGFDTYDDSAVRNGGVIAVLRRAAGSWSWAGWLLPRRLLDRLLTTQLLGLPLAEAGASAPGGRTTDAALSYLDGLLADPGPWFLFLHYMDPHKPYWPDAGVRGSLADYDALPERYRSRQPWKQEIALLQKDLLTGPGDARARRAAEVLHRIYDEETAFIDSCLGRVLERIEAGGRPTVILFTADHGEAFGEHGLMLHGNSVYGELLRVPFLLKVPGVTAGRLPGRPRLEQVAPTLLDAAGLGRGEPVRGSLLASGRPDEPPHLAGRALEPGANPVPGWPQTGFQLGLRAGPLKLVAYAPELGPGVAAEARELYDLDADADETRNLLSRDPAAAAAMLETLEGLLRRAVRGEGGEMSAEQRALLEELGYAGG